MVRNAEIHIVIILCTNEVTEDWNSPVRMSMTVPAYNIMRVFLQIGN